MDKWSPVWNDLNDLCCVLDNWAYGVPIDGANRYQVRHPATGDGHRNIGTPGGKADPIGKTFCTAFGIRIENATEFPALMGSDWVVVWQQQQSGPPMTSIEVPASAPDPGDDWYVQVRSNGGNQTKVALAPFHYGQWDFFVICYYLADAPNGWVKAWHKTGSAPDVTQNPAYERTGIDSYWANGHETMGLYMSGSTRRTASFWGYGRAGTPQRAIQLANLP